MAVSSTSLIIMSLCFALLRFPERSGTFLLQTIYCVSSSGAGRLTFIAQYLGRTTFIPSSLELPSSASYSLSSPLFSSSLTARDDILHFHGISVSVAGSSVATKQNYWDNTTQLNINLALQNILRNTLSAVSLDRNGLDTDVHDFVEGACRNQHIATGGVFGDRK